VFFVFAGQSDALTYSRAYVTGRNQHQQNELKRASAMQRR